MTNTESRSESAVTLPASQPASLSPSLPPSLPPSLWAATAIPAAATPPLAESIQIDVAIIGGGFTGLSTALHLAEAGVACCVIDTGEPGWGASGRNGGQVNPTLKHDPSDLLRMYGPEQGEALIEAIGGSADVVYGLIDRHRIECDPVRNGWLQVAHSSKAIAGLHARAEQWARRGVRTEILDQDAVARRVGTRTFAGGWLDSRAGSIQPLSFTRGLVKAALARGVRIHGHTQAVALSDVAGQASTGAPRRWRIDTAHGASITAERVVIATNGYTGDLWPRLRQTVIAANSFIAATRPLTGADAQAILPGGETISNTQRLLLYYRRDAQGRLLMGGRGRFAEPSGPEDFRHLERSVALLYPQLGSVQYDYRWAGRVAITRDFMPHVHEPAPGITIALGYNGRGIASATTIGKHLAARLVAGDDAPFAFPITPIRPIPLHGLQRLYITAGVAWYGLLDRFGA